MKRIASGWICLVVFALYAFYPALVGLSHAQGAAGGQALAGSRGGEAIPMPAPPPPEEKPSKTPWIITGVSALAAMVIGSALVLDDTDDSKDDADAAADAAAAAAAAAAGAAGAAGATASAAEQPGEGTGPAVQTYVTISGVFEHPNAIECSEGKGFFTPSMTFDQSALPGGRVTALTASGCGDDAAGTTIPGGEYDSPPGGSIILRVDDPFYAGTATALPPSSIRLSNGTVLGATGGAFVRVDTASQ